MTDSNDLTASRSLAATAQESTRDLAKLLISLASAVVVLSATFTEKLASGVGVAILVLFLAWVALASAVLSGVKALSILVHVQRTDADRWAAMTLPFMRLSWRSFQTGMVLLLIFAAIASAKAAWQPRPPDTEASTCECYLAPSSAQEETP